MSIRISYVMKKSDWVKLAILIVVGAVAITGLYREYLKTNQEFDNAVASLQTEGR